MDSLIAISYHITRIVLPIFIVAGTVGNSLTVTVLLRPMFYPYACSRYLLAVAINNVFYSSVVLIYQLLTTGYQYDPSQTSVFICKVMVFLFHTSAFVSPYNIVLASMERYFASSTYVHLRRLSNVRFSRWAIACLISCLALFNLNTFILTTAIPENGPGCLIPDNTIYNQIYVVAQCILYAVTAPALMALFGYLTVRNLRQVRVLPVVASSHRRTERQLARMLLLQMSIYILLNVPIAVTYLIAIMPVTFKTTAIFFLINTCTQTLTYTFDSASFLAYILGTRSYREEFIKIFKEILRMTNGQDRRVGTQTMIRNNALQTMVMPAGTQPNPIMEPTLTQQNAFT